MYLKLFKVNIYIYAYLKKLEQNQCKVFEASFVFTNSIDFVKYLKIALQFLQHYEC